MRCLSLFNNCLPAICTQHTSIHKQVLSWNTVEKMGFSHPVRYIPKQARQQIL